MSELLQAFVASSDKVYKRVRGKDGRLYHFKDGTPISGSTFNMVESRYKRHDGQPAKIAVPSKKGPGYEVKEVSPKAASSIAVEVSYIQEDSGKVARDTVTIAGKTYDTKVIGDLNDRIIDQTKTIEGLFRYN